MKIIDKFKLAQEYILNTFQISDDIEYKQKRVLRIIVENKDGSVGTGSCFFINNNGTALTCFHVVAGKELTKLRPDNDFNLIVADNEHEKLKVYLKNRVKKIFTEIDGFKLELKLENFDEIYDIAMLTLVNLEDISKVSSVKIDFNTNIKYGDHVFFAGFPVQFSYKLTDSPFAVHSGIISAFPKTVIGGDLYEHIQINSINLGGNSGAPLFFKKSNKVIGIINGNMNYGFDNFLFENNAGAKYKNEFRVPLSIAYATPIKLIKNMSKVNL